MSVQTYPPNGHSQLAGYPNVGTIFIMYSSKCDSPSRTTSSSHCAPTSRNMLLYHTLTCPALPPPPLPPPPTTMQSHRASKGRTTPIQVRMVSEDDSVRC